MPLVRIDLRKGKPVEYVRAVSESVLRAIVEVLAAPARDNFQVITEHDPDHLVYSPDDLDIARSNDVIFVQITLLSGRDAAKRQAFYGRVVELLKEKPKLRPEDVLINLVESKPEDWSFGNGVGQYMVLPREKWT
jgi:4-oxalocrotonate tautomerase